MKKIEGGLQIALRSILMASITAMSPLNEVGGGSEKVDFSVR